ncbi:MAG: DUF3887 domain-containing protein [Clostridiales bacterium]|jgi:ATP-dependent Lon protease|nr:DUF3887 domain-containing protein [Clostridiales bacterium]
MKKILTSILAAALIFSLAACSSNKLAEVYKEDEVIARAKEIVDIINTYSYDEVTAELREDLQDQLTAEQLESALDSQLKAAGEFLEYKTEAVYGQKDSSEDKDYAVAVLICKYENASLTYTISMDKDLNIVGLYMK